MREKRYEIAPGYGAPGISAARQRLLSDLRDAIVKAIGHADKVYIDSDTSDPAVRVRFDDHTTLWVSPWPHVKGGCQGFAPNFRCFTTRGGSLLVGVGPRPLNWQSEVDIALAACRVVLASVALVEIPAGVIL